VGDSVGVGHLKPSFLEIIAVIKLRTADKEGAFRIDDDVHPLGGDKDVTGHRAIDEIHFILETGATAANHGNSKGAIRTALLGEKGGEAIGSRIRDSAELFIPDLPREW